MRDTAQRVPPTSSWASLRRGDVPDLFRVSAADANVLGTSWSGWRSRDTYRASVRPGRCALLDRDGDAEVRVTNLAGQSVPWPARPGRLLWRSRAGHRRRAHRGRGPVTPMTLARLSREGYDRFVAHTSATNNNWRSPRAMRQCDRAEIDFGGLKSARLSALYSWLARCACLTAGGSSGPGSSCSSGRVSAPARSSASSRSAASVFRDRIQHHLVDPVAPAPPLLRQGGARRLPLAHATGDRQDLLRRRPARRGNLQPSHTSPGRDLLQHGYPGHVSPDNHTTYAL